MRDVLYNKLRFSHLGQLIRNGAQFILVRDSTIYYRNHPLKGNLTKTELCPKMLQDTLTSYLQSPNLNGLDIVTRYTRVIADSSPSGDLVIRILLLHKEQNVPV